MPKKTETRDKVHEAADILLANGQRPTQQAVRDLLGTGSITTINIALNDWWGSLSQRLNRQSEHPALPEPVITAASKLWDQALAYSEASLEDQRAALNKAFEDNKQASRGQLTEVQTTLSLVQNQNSQLLDANSALVEEKNALSQRIHELESSLIAANVKNEELERAQKQQNILLENNTNALDDSHSTDFIQVKIDLKVSESIIENLKKSLSLKEELNEKLQQQLFDEEKKGIRQIHRLEMVIAQQDLKYINLKEQFEKTEGYFK